MRFANKLFLTLIIFYCCFFLSYSTDKKLIPDSDFIYNSPVQNNNILSLPADLPLPVVDSLNKPSPGGIFLSPFGPAASDTGKYKNYLMIVDTACKVVSYKLVPLQDQGYVGYHFKEEPNGLLSYLNRKLDGTVFLTDTSYNILTSFKDTLNPYNRVKYFAHFDVLPNGHYLDVRYDFMYMDLTKYFPKGEPNGAILQAVIQELDKDKNVVFNWRSVDYVPVSNTLDPLTPAIDYFHPNSMVLDNDGNILLSGRDINAILKINRNTGNIIWTLGGKQNQFKFVGENEKNAPNYFSYQHDIRRNPNGNITIFDNGRQHSPQYSRGIEYKLDEVSKTCTLVWEYRHTPDYFADVYGTTQRLPNGNTLIGWGQYSQNGGTSLSELHPDNSVAMEFHFPAGLQSQFIYKYPWPACPLIASVTKKELLELNTYDFSDSLNKTGVTIICNKLNAFTYNQLTIEKYDCSPMNPDFTGRPPIVSPYRLLFKPSQIYAMKNEIHVSLSQYPLIFQPGKTLLFNRPKEGNGIFNPLQTTYDSNKNELIAISDTTGEFIFGYIDSAVITPPPILYSPVNNGKPNFNFPVQFDWSPRGYFTGSNIQVATDTLFSNIIIDTSLKVITFSSNKFNKGQKYFWRVRSSNDAGFSNWSQIRNFSASDPYLSMIVPNGGETWYNDSTKYIIRWNYNVVDSINALFRIELYRNGAFVKILKDSLFSAVNAFAWLIPKTTPVDSTYQIKVTSIKFGTLNSTSAAYFSIKTPTGVPESDLKPQNIINLQVYPNPVHSDADFKFNIELPDRVSMDIIDIFGNRLEQLLNEQYLPAANYDFKWSNKFSLPTGQYFCRLRAGNSINTIKFIVIK